MRTQLMNYVNGQKDSYSAYTADEVKAELEVLNEKLQKLEDYYEIVEQYPELEDLDVEEESVKKTYKDQEEVMERSAQIEADDRRQIRVRMKNLETHDSCKRPCPAGN